MDRKKLLITIGAALVVGTVGVSALYFTNPEVFQGSLGKLKFVPMLPVESDSAEVEKRAQLDSETGIGSKEIGLSGDAEGISSNSGDKTIEKDGVEIRIPEAGLDDDDSGLSVGVSNDNIGVISNTIGLTPVTKRAPTLLEDPEVKNITPPGDMALVPEGAKAPAITQLDCQFSGTMTLSNDKPASFSCAVTPTDTPTHIEAFLFKDHFASLAEATGDTFYPLHTMQAAKNIFPFAWDLKLDGEVAATGNYTLFVVAYGPDEGPGQPGPVVSEVSQKIVVEAPAAPPEMAQAEKKKLELSCAASPMKATAGQTVTWKVTGSTGMSFELLQSRHLADLEWSGDVTGKGELEVSKPYSPAMTTTYKAEVTLSSAMLAATYDIIPGKCSVMVEVPVQTSMTEPTTQTTTTTTTTANTGSTGSSSSGSSYTGSTYTGSSSTGSSSSTSPTSPTGASTSATTATNSPTDSAASSELAADTEAVVRLAETGLCKDARKPSDTANHWAHIYINALISNCNANGYPDGTFKPDQKVTRAEAAKLVFSAAGYEEYKGCKNSACGTTFRDTDSIPTLIGWIRVGWMHGFFMGRSASEAAPNDSITRAEAAALIVRAFGVETPATCAQPHCNAGGPDNTFYDIMDMWQGQSVFPLAEYGLVKGIGPNMFGPNNAITRGELAKILSLALELE